MQTVRELMTSAVEYVEADWSVLQTIALMKEKRIGSVLVKKKDVIVGIFTERDLMTKMDLTRPAAIQTVTIRDVMTPSPISADVNASVDEVFDTMQKHGIRHLPITDAGHFVGVVSSRDLLRHRDASNR